MSSAVRLVQSSVGPGLHGFRHVRSAAVPTFRLTLEELAHERTGCRVVHLARDDANNAFAIQLRTTPTDSTGAPHILEHSVLCGSRKYPVRDPFFKMLTRSQATFMNAMTAPDCTIYPCSTQNHADFYNLFSVYLDAVFHPLLSRQDFLQEGWRLEPTDLQDPKSPLTIKGVVYNEMKGVFSDPDQLFACAVRQNLLPGGPYRHNYGGFPAAIPELSHEQLREFHRTHYHPSNATVFTYGNIPLAEHLKFLDQECLGAFERMRCDTEVPLEPRWTKPRVGRMEGPLNPFLPPDRQVTFAESFMFGDICSVRDNFALHFVSSLLCEGDTSPFYSGLLECGLGTAFAPVHGFSTEARNAAFHVGLKGLAEESVAAARQRVDDILAETVRAGFRRENVEALLHQVELSLRDEGANYGLEKILALSGPANHGADLAQLLGTEDMLVELRDKLAAEPRFLQNLVAKHWRSNQHRLSLSLHPGPRFADRLVAAERTAATARAASADLTAVRREAQELLAAQTARADPGPLPRLALSDLPRSVPRWPAVWAQPERLLLFPQPTNGLVYFRAKVTLSGRQLTPGQVRLLPLLAHILPKLGTRDTPYGLLAEAVDRISGGFACTPYAIGRPEDVASCEFGLLLSACCLAANLPRVLQLWREICGQPDWAARDRVTSLLRMEASELVSRLTGQGHVFAAGRACARVSEPGRVSELLTGLDSLRAVKLAVAAGDAGGGISLEGLAEDLAALCRAAFRLDNFCLSLTGEGLDSGAKEAEAFLCGLEGAADAPDAAPAPLRADLSAALPVPSGLFEHFEVGSMGVNFCAMAQPCPGVTDPQFPALMLAAAHLSSRYLHREVREIGGAYGSGARATPGAFYFMSYRDPRSLRTLDTFAASADWLARPDNLTASDLEEAKLAVFKALDMPVPPKKRGLELFLTGVTDDMRQQLRDRLFGLGPAEVREAAARALGPQRRAHRVIIGSRNLELDFKQWSSATVE